MTATMLAQAAYATSAAPIRTDRSVEYTAFETVTARLLRAQRPGASMPEIARALHDNRRLWTTLAVDLAGHDNALPQGLRAELFFLAEFSLLQSRKALRQRDAIGALVEVNRAVMRGLDGIAAPT